METTELKSLWKAIPNPQKNSEQLLQMFKESNQPILRAIKNQLLFEILGFSLFLVCYYSMFDAHQKPIWVNLFLALAILAPIFHNLKGYQLYQKAFGTHSLKANLTNYLKQVNNYTVQVLICRIVFAGGLLFFFSYGLTFGPKKWLILAGIGLIFSIQLAYLYQIWAKRINRLKANINALNEV